MAAYGKTYCLVNWKETPEGSTPDLPEEIRWRLVADPPQKPRHRSEDLMNPKINYSVFLVDWPEEMPWPPEMEFVPEELTQLLDSAIYDYPPALAIARDRVRKPKEEISRSEFMKALANALRTLLEEQRNAPYFLAKVLNEEVGYKSVGEYCWIVGCREYGGRMNVSWVSGDCFVYGDPATHFDIDLDWLKERFKVEA